MTVSTNPHATRQDNSWRDVDVVFNATVMIYQSTCVQNDIITNLHARIDHNPSHDCNTPAQNSRLRNDGSGMHHIYNNQTEPGEVFKDLCSWTVISDSSHP